MFCYKRIVHVYETDLMGIVHHSNYLRFCEEARVEWCRLQGLIPTDGNLRQESVFDLTVYETRVRHLGSARYGDTMEIDVQVKVEGVRIIFQYRIRLSEKILCLAETVHCRIDQNYKIKRLDGRMTAIAGKVPWTETWL